MDRVLQGDRGEDAELLDQALKDKQVVMVPVVLTELLSDPKLEPDVGRTLAALPLSEVRDGFWSRAGRPARRSFGKAEERRDSDML